MANLYLNLSRSSKAQISLFPQFRTKSSLNTWYSILMMITNIRETKRIFKAFLIALDFPLCKMSCSQEKKSTWRQFSKLRARGVLPSAQRAPGTSCSLVRAALRNP